MSVRPARKAQSSISSAAGPTPDWGVRAQESARCRSRGLKGIVFYAPAEMTLCAKAGTTLDEVEAAVSEQGQILPFEPMSPRALWGAPAEPTLGGMVATNLSGPRRITAGAAARQCARA